MTYDLHDLSILHTRRELEEKECCVAPETTIQVRWLDVSIGGPA